MRTLSEAIKPPASLSNTIKPQTPVNKEELKKEGILNLKRLFA